MDICEESDANDVTSTQQPKVVDLSHEENAAAAQSHPIIDLTVKNVASSYIEKSVSANSNIESNHDPKARVDADTDAELKTGGALWTYLDQIAQYDGHIRDIYEWGCPR